MAILLLHIYYTDISRPTGPREAEPFLIVDVMDS